VPPSEFKQSTTTQCDSKERAQAFQAAGRAGEAVGQPVRGGLWEADLGARRMACVYWPEPAHRVARGTWFLEKGVDWVPLQVGPAAPGAATPQPHGQDCGRGVTNRRPSIPACAPCCLRRGAHARCEPAPCSQASFPMRVHLCARSVAGRQAACLLMQLQAGRE
jgi:hypothetical protein